MRVITSSVITILALALTGCVSVNVPSPRLTKHEAIQIAVAVAERAGEHLDDYKAPDVRFDSTERRWSIYFDHKPPGFPGGYGWVYVDDKTGVGRLLPSD